MTKTSCQCSSDRSFAFVRHLGRYSSLSLQANTTIIGEDPGASHMRISISHSPERPSTRDLGNSWYALERHDGSLLHRKLRLIPPFHLERAFFAVDDKTERYFPDHRRTHHNSIRPSGVSGINLSLRLYILP